MESFEFDATASETISIKYLIGWRALYIYLYIDRNSNASNDEGAGNMISLA